MPYALIHIMLHVNVALLITIYHSILEEALLYYSIQLVKIIYCSHVVDSHVKICFLQSL